MCVFNTITIKLPEAFSFNKACHVGDTVSLNSLSSTLRKLCSSAVPRIIVARGHRSCFFTTLLTPFTQQGEH